MKKMLMMGMLLGLCGNSMGAEYNPHKHVVFKSTGTPSQKSRVYEQRDAHINLEDFDEGQKLWSDTNKVKSLKTKLTKEKELSNYYYRYSQDAGAFSMSAMMGGVLACGIKIASYLRTIYICNGIKIQGGTCTIDPCDPHVRSHLPKSSADTCELNLFADTVAYVSIGLFVGVTIYSIYKFNHAPRQSITKID